jgi:divalent metal cation (Fe/Co/Zn/Cd) transporter
VVKLGCYFWSRSIDNSGVQALAQDAMNDVVFKFVFNFWSCVTGSSCSLIVPLIGQWFQIWWLDSVGAIVISLYIIYEWIHTYYPSA